MHSASPPSAWQAWSLWQGWVQTPQMQDSSPQSLSWSQASSQCVSLSLLLRWV
jgi:hypothetical protein